MQIGERLSLQVCINLLVKSKSDSGEEIPDECIGTVQETKLFFIVIITGLRDCITVFSFLYVSLYLSVTYLVATCLIYLGIIGFARKVSKEVLLHIGINPDSTNFSKLYLVICSPGGTKNLGTVSNASTSMFLPRLIYLAVSNLFPISQCSFLSN